MYASSLPGQLVCVAYPICIGYATHTLLEFNVESMTEEISKCNQLTTEATTSNNNTKVGNRVITPTRQTIVTNNIKWNDESTTFSVENTTESENSWKQYWDSLEEGATNLEKLVSTFKRVKHFDISMTFYCMYIVILVPFITWILIVLFIFIIILIQWCCSVWLDLTSVGIMNKTR